MPIRLAENSYGSSRIHLLRVSKQQGRHDVREIAISIRFEGDFEAAHTQGDNRKFFAAEEEIPQCAITMGIGTILEAKRILLLASGSSKATAIAKAIEGPLTASVTASALQLHSDVTFIVDREAGAQLKQQEYYQRVLEMTAILTPERL